MHRGQLREVVSSWLRPIRQKLSNIRARSNVSSTQPPSNQIPETAPPADVSYVPGCDQNAASHEATGIRPVTGRTTDETGASQVNAPAAGEGPPEKDSCWSQAYKNLTEHPQLGSKIQALGQDLDIGADPERLLEYVHDSRNSPEPLPRWLEQSIRSVLQFKELFNAAASLDPFRCAPIVVKGTTLILEACVDGPHLRQVVENDLNDVTSWTAYWRNIESLYFNAASQSIEHRFKDLEKSLVELYTKIFVLIVEVQRITTRGTLSEIAQSQSLREIWKPIFEQVSRNHGICKTTFDRCKLEIEQHGRIKRWISGYQREDFHLDALRRTQVATKFPDCGQWFLDSDEFNQWSPEDHVLWIRGTTGTGKTTLIARLIQYHLDRTALSRDQRLVYIYCIPGQAYRAVLLALLRQAAFDPVTEKVFEQIQIAYQSSGGDSEDLRAFNFEASYEDILCGILQSGIKLKIFIDALNLCDDPDRVLSTINDVSTRSPGCLELLFSSTRIRYVENVFTPIIVDTHSVSSKMETDMMTFIQREVQDRRAHRRLLEGELPEVENELMRILYRRAGGMFRWVELQLSFFFNSPHERSEETIRGYLQDLDIRSVAGEEDLKAVYDAIFDRNTAANDIERRCATLIYQLMMCSKRPIDTKLAVAAVKSMKGESNIVSGNENRDLRSMSNMTRDFAMETQGGKLDFAHHSVIEYLQRQHGLEYSGAIPHAKVALRCLDTLSNCRRNRYEARLENDAFFRYCHQFWGYHCSRLSKQEQDELGVTEALQQWILDPNEVTTFAEWCQQTGVKTVIPDLDCETHELPRNMDVNPILACSIWNLEGLLEILVPNPPAFRYLERSGFFRDDLIQHPDSSFGVNRSPWSGRRSLAWAAACGHETMVNILLGHGAEINHRERDSLASALDLAASHGHVTIVRNLIARGAEVKHEGGGYEWEHPLHLAAMKGHVEVVVDLLRALAMHSQGVNPIYWTSNLSEPSPLIEDLVNAGSPLSRASEFGQEDVVKVLLDHQGTEVEFRTGTGETPLMLAARGCHQGVIQRLLNKGADVNAIDGDGRTALMKASESGFNLEVIRLLLAREGLDAKIKDQDGHNAIYWAKKDYLGHPDKNKLAIEELLREAGVPHEEQ